ncbi:gas vesicle protein GvpJ [Rhodococcus sp. C26F]|uniref:Gas vesicle protein GvpA/GvpJ/GvpM family n=2 Tax=Rhodococcus TaxID=1827 RepID=A0A562ERS7_RHORH|nr:MULTISPECIES: gas vesicle protein GvpJ [Rhodococcus]KSZ57791.1 gas vesicle protein [Rhodococcus pyridinivorans KG-16]TWH24750.1 gas vesicle protein GvpA/GvpJ/GvpM family [Rhodococcus rhodochrous J45]
MTVVGGGGGTSSPQPYGGGGRSTNLGDILERVLDKGLVIAGDIQVNLLDIELLTIKLRLVIASLETAKAVGIDWWESDPWLTSKARAPEVDSSRAELELENRQLRERLAALEARAEELEPEPAEIVDEEDRD